MECSCGNYDQEGRSKRKSAENSGYLGSVRGGSVSDVSVPNLSHLNASDLEWQHKRFQKIIDQRFSGFNVQTPCTVISPNLRSEKGPSVISDGILHRTFEPSLYKPAEPTKPHNSKPCSNLISRNDNEQGRTNFDLVSQLLGTKEKTEREPLRPETSRTLTGIIQPREECTNLQPASKTAPTCKLEQTQCQPTHDLTVNKSVRSSTTNDQNKSTTFATEQQLLNTVPSPSTELPEKPSLSQQCLQENSGDNEITDTELCQSGTLDFRQHSDTVTMTETKSVSDGVSSSSSFESCDDLDDADSEPKEIHLVMENAPTNMSIESSDPHEVDLSLLAPLCEVLDREVVSMSKEICGVKKGTKDQEKLLFLLIVYRIYDKLNSPMHLEKLCILVFVDFTRQMQSVVNQISAGTQHGKLRIIVSNFEKVFCISSDVMSRRESAESWLMKSFQDTMKKILEECIEQEKKSLADLCTALQDIIGPTSIPWFGALVPEDIGRFIIEHVKTLTVVNDVVFPAQTLQQSSTFLTTSQPTQKKVIAFFHEFLKSSAIPYIELSTVLSRCKPELLAELVERNSDAVFAILMKDQFKYQDGMVMLKGYKPAPNHLRPSLNSSSATENSGICSCCCGIVLCVGKARATFWCSYSNTCKNVIVIARRSSTFVNGVVVNESFRNILKVDDRVVFTTETMSNEGWTIECAVQVKVVLEQERESSCLCPHKVKMSLFEQQVIISNGISAFESLTFFWNTKGTVLELKGTKGIIKCMVNDSSDRYILAYFTNRTWFVGCDLFSLKSLCGVLAVGDEMELDMSLINYNNTGFLTWFCICMRKTSDKQETSRVLLNCVGSVVEKETDSFSVRIPSDDIQYAVPFRTSYLTSDGDLKTILTPQTLEKGETVIFDMEVTKLFVAKFVRKCVRPDFYLSEINISSKAVGTVPIEMCKDSPMFGNLLQDPNREAVTIQECEEIQTAHQKSGLEIQSVYMDSLSLTSDSYGVIISNTISIVKDTSCQTVSTGPVLSSVLPM